MALSHGESTVDTRHCTWCLINVCLQIRSAIEAVPGVGQLATFINTDDAVCTETTMSAADLRVYLDCRLRWELHSCMLTQVVR